MSANKFNPFSKEASVVEVYGKVEEDPFEKEYSKYRLLWKARDQDKPPSEIMSFKVMTCVICFRWCPPPLYLCATAGHLFCFSCAALHETCNIIIQQNDKGQKFCNGKIFPKKIIPYDELFGGICGSNKYNCVNQYIGCKKTLTPATFVSHALTECEFRREFKCLDPATCRYEKALIFYGYMNYHLATLHETALFTQLDGKKCVQPVKIFLKNLREDRVLLPVLMDNKGMQKFILAIKKASGKVFFWVWMVTDGLQHDNTKFEAEIVLNTKDDVQRNYSYKYTLQDCKSMGSIFQEENNLSVDFHELKRTCVYKDDNTYPCFIMTFAIRKLN